MSHQYQAIAWNRQKRVYDVCAGHWSHGLSDVVYRSQRASLSLCYGENLDHPRGWIRRFPASPHRPLYRAALQAGPDVLCHCFIIAGTSV